MEPWDCEFCLMMMMMFIGTETLVTQLVPWDCEFCFGCLLVPLDDEGVGLGDGGRGGQ